ncbi:hypothetical protein T01_2935 [Trichinella spiralis]|uniref:Uncharacterized protein n=1 Tax=Trichinella spiralis TaxID=6334 RepID=A0A0V1AIF1_TRISP|nr:hypothetical protein T01_2935 [Trichinella spiralis]
MLWFVHAIVARAFGAIRRMYHELREKDAVLQNVDDPNMRAELEREFEEESASTKRHTIGVMRLIGMHCTVYVVAVFRFAFRPKFARVVSFRSRQS